MQIDKINNTNFKAVNAKQAHSVLLSRLNSPKRYIKYKDFVTAQDKKNFDIVLSDRGKRSLAATVYNKEGVILFCETENVLNGIFNRSPMRFLKKVSNAAENFYTPIRRIEENNLL